MQTQAAQIPGCVLARSGLQLDELIALNQQVSEAHVAWSTVRIDRNQTMYGQSMSMCDTGRAVKKYVRSHQGPFANWNPKLIQYVSPQVWASREGRARKMAQDFDLLLSIFPFEKEWYAERVPRLRVEFVGHPIIDRHPDVGRAAKPPSEPKFTPASVKPQPPPPPPPRQPPRPMSRLHQDLDLRRH